MTGTSGQRATVYRPLPGRRLQRACSFKPEAEAQPEGRDQAHRPPGPESGRSPTRRGGAYANIASAQVALPHSEFLDQGNLNKICTQAGPARRRLPEATSIYGKAKAWTPLLDKPLEGPVYLGGGFGYKLPALVAELNGQIRVLLVGKVDSGKNKGIRNTFEAVPDAPVSKFVLEMKGGKKYGLLENSENLCKQAAEGRSPSSPPRTARSISPHRRSRTGAARAPSTRADTTRSIGVRTARRWGLDSAVPRNRMAPVQVVAMDRRSLGSSTGGAGKARVRGVGSPPA